MSRKNWWSRQRAVFKAVFVLPGTEHVSGKLILLRSVIGALLCFFVARAFLFSTWSEVISFTLVMVVVFVFVNTITEIVLASYRHDLQEQRELQRPRAPSYQPQYLTEADLFRLRANLIGAELSDPDIANEESMDYQHEIEEAKFLLIGPASTWHKTITELSRRRLEETVRYEQKLGSLTVTRRQENDEVVRQLEVQVDRIKLYLRDLQDAEAAMNHLIAEMGAKLDALLDVSNDADSATLWHKPVIARLGKLHGFIKKFPLHLPKAGEDAKLIHFSEELEVAREMFKDVYTHRY